MKAKLYDLIKKPVISEKSTLLASQNKYVFEVDLKASKSEVKQAIEAIFGVKVVAVNTIKGHGKVKRFRGILGKQNDYKKAVVTLAEGGQIDVTGSVK